MSCLLCISVRQEALVYKTSSSTADYMILPYSIKPDIKANELRLMYVSSTLPGTPLQQCSPEIRKQRKEGGEGRWAVGAGFGGGHKWKAKAQKMP